jgi:proteic killer suppression protein
MIQTFGDPDTERLFERRFVKRLAYLADTALRRLVALDAAKRLSDLRIPPSNRLEALTGDRMGQHSLRINDQYRVCFRWKEGNAYDVEITKHYR